MNSRLWIAGGLLSLAATLPAAAHPVTFTGTLSSAGEAAPSPGTGSVLVVFDDDAFTINVHVDFSGLLGTTTASHIHCCTASPGTGSAGVATQTPSFINFPMGVQSGTYDHFFDLTDATSWNQAFINANGGTTASAFAALSTGLNSGEAYLNIHTNVAPGGEIRAFLAPVPLPAAAWLLVSGLGLVGSAVRRRLA